MNKPEYYTVAQAAEELGVSERTVRQRIKEGRYQGEKVTTPKGWEWRIYPLGEEEREPEEGLGKGSERVSEPEGVGALRIAGPPEGTSRWERLEQEVAQLRRELGQIREKVRRWEEPPRPPAEADAAGNRKLLTAELEHPRLQGLEPKGLHFLDGRDIAGEWVEISRDHVVTNNPDNPQEVLLVPKQAIKFYRLGKPSR